MKQPCFIHRKNPRTNRRHPYEVGGNYRSNWILDEQKMNGQKCASNGLLDNFVHN
jgi:hypothetical protein